MIIQNHVAKQQQHEPEIVPTDKILFPITKKNVPKKLRHFVKR
jgi:hypothetical protein